MNIAFPAILLILLVLPGVIFRRSLRSGKAFRERLTLADEIGLSIVTATLLQSLWLIVVHCCEPFDLRVDLQSLLVLLSGKSGVDNETALEAIRSVADYPLPIGLYFFTLGIAAYVFGFLARHYLPRYREVCGSFGRKFRNCLGIDWAIDGTGTLHSAFQLSQSIDTRDHYGDDQANRSYSQWMRSCEIEIEEDGELGETFVLVMMMAAVIELGGQPYLFKGIVEKAYFGTNGDLEKLTLLGAMRRTLDNDAPPEEEDLDPSDSLTWDRSGRYYHIKQGTFIVQMKEAKTVNFSYFAILPPESNGVGYEQPAQTPPTEPVANPQ